MSARLFEGPSTRIRLLETASESGGARLRFEQTIAVGAASPPRHVHAIQTETFVVRAGRLGLEAKGERVVLEAGESLAVPPGTPHTFWNAGDEPCVHEVRLEPALDMEHFFEGIVTLEATNRLPPHGRPDLARIALLFAVHGNFVAGAPRWAQAIAHRVVIGVSRLVGLRAPRWEDRHTLLRPELAEAPP